MLNPALKSRRSERGLTLIELMITIAVLAVGLSLAAPSFTMQVSNYRVRAAAESMLNGLNYARTEAVRRNRPVSFTLSVSGSGWSVDQVNPAETLQTRADGETAGLTVVSTSTSRAVTFTSTGLVDTSGIRLTQVNLSAPASSSNTRRIDIFGGGLIRMCDPGVATVGDPRRC